MGSYASVNGRILPAAEASVSVLDNGFAFGDSVYETLRTYAGRPFALARHLARLRASAARLAFAIPQGDAEIAEGLAELLRAAGNEESYLRLIVSRGVGDLSYRFERVQGPTLVAVVKPLEPIPEAQRRDGVALALVSVRRNHPLALDPAIKSSNLLNNVLATREAQARGALEALLLNAEGHLAEGAGSNVFVVRGGVVRTPPLDEGLLAGITRALVIETAERLAIPLREEPLLEADVRSAEELFVTSTLKEVLPGVRLDGAAIGDGRPGPITRRLQAAYSERTRSHDA
jgi:branched-chain amino acid aminotransferase